MFEQHFQRQRTLAPSFEEEGNLNQDNIILPSLEFIFSGKVKGFFFFFFAHLRMKSVFSSIPISMARYPKGFSSKCVK